MPKEDEKREIPPLSAENQAYEDMAKHAETAERYEDMVEWMKKIIADESLAGDKLKNETRNLISVGYKNVMSARRTSYRTIQSTIDEAPSSGLTQAEIELLQQYRTTINKELTEIIEEIENKVVKVFTEGARAATYGDILVFFHKLNGDYNRYGAEASTGEAREHFKAKAKEAYEKAQGLCEVYDQKDHLEETSPIRLGLALNFSVFNYEIDGNQERAREIAQVAFDNAIDKLDSLDEEEYRDSTLIMQLLKDNLTLWDQNDKEGQ